MVDKAKDMGIDTTTIIQSGHIFRQNPEIGTEIRLGEQMDFWVVSNDGQDSLRIVDEWRPKIHKVLMNLKMTSNTIRTFTSLILIVGFFALKTSAQIQLLPIQQSTDFLRTNYEGGRRRA